MYTKPIRLRQTPSSLVVLQFPSRPKTVQVSSPTVQEGLHLLQRYIGAQKQGRLEQLALLQAPLKGWEQHFHQKLMTQGRQ